MVRRPTVGLRVQVWYARARIPYAPWHGKVGVVVVVAMGPGPRNHGVLIDGRLVVVPAGNLRPANVQERII
jgi:hypothetical protein